MSRFKLFSVALILSGATAAPAFAQAAIQEPGAYAFYHPDGDLLHARSARPAPDAMAMVVPRDSGRMARHGMRTMSHRAVTKHPDRFEMR
jgi:hypothetical protein